MHKASKFAGLPPQRARVKEVGLRSSSFSVKEFLLGISRTIRVRKFFVVDVYSLAGVADAGSTLFRDGRFFVRLQEQLLTLCSPTGAIDTVSNLYEVGKFFVPSRNKILLADWSS